MSGKSSTLISVHCQKNKRMIFDLESGNWDKLKTLLWFLFTVTFFCPSHFTLMAGVISVVYRLCIVNVFPRKTLQVFFVLFLLHKMVFIVALTCNSLKLETIQCSPREEKKIWLHLDLFLLLEYLLSISFITTITKKMLFIAINVHNDLPSEILPLCLKV